MKLTSARLRNIACFEDITLDFTNEATREPAPWVVLLGENGTGKSTILQMLGALLVGSYGLSTIAGDVTWRRYIRRLDQYPCVTTVELNSGDDELNPLRVDFLIDRASFISTSGSIFYLPEHRYFQQNESSTSELSEVFLNLDLRQDLGHCVWGQGNKPIKGECINH